MNQTAASHLQPAPTTPREARRFVDQALKRWGRVELRDLATLLTCELVTNAVLHARSEVLLRVEVGPECLRVEVGDDDPAVPEVREPAVAEDATTGRGLVLVDGLSSSWGVEAHGDGKTVWFELAAS